MMKRRSVLVLAVAIMIILATTACSNKITKADIVTPESIEIAAAQSPSSGQSYLYGEMHGIEALYDMEIELWDEYYNKEGMRHLFVELPYYTAEYLNVWMQSDNNDILNMLFRDWIGTSSYNTNNIRFLKEIKNYYPETIFHGTDVGHCYETTGKKFLEYLRENNLEDSEKYHLTKEAIKQGKNYYKVIDSVYRENVMVENFIREFDKLDGESIMGIYGSAHTGLEAMDFSNTVPCMGNQLNERYGHNIHSVDLRKFIEPERVDTIQVGGKDYLASYFGRYDTPGLKDYKYLEFWRLENVYEDFVDNPKNGNVLPYLNYPMFIETGQVFIIDYSKIDGSIIREYYRSDGNRWDNMETTEEFTVEW